MIRLVEIMSSLQGEGKSTGLPTTFVRLYGCNLRCTFCDAKYTYSGNFERVSAKSIIDRVKEIGNMHICITGGEPLMQEGVHELASELAHDGYRVSIETNGAVALRHHQTRNYTYCMDIKCPSSGMDKKNIYNNMSLLSPYDEVKFVISDRIDYYFAVKVVRDNITEANIIFSPVFNEDNTHNGGLLAQWILEGDLPYVTLGLQIHKLLNIY